MSPFVQRTVRLNDGNEIPVIAFGTGTSQAWTDTSPVVSSALSNGLIHIDSAYHYKNAKFTGDAIRNSGLHRDEFYVTTKGAAFEAEPDDFDARFYLTENLKDLGLEYVDLFLIHADILVGDVQKAWKQMEELKKEGLTRSIGVSNFSTKSLQAILDICEIPPALNQIEFHPYSLPTYLPTLLPLQAKHKIVTAAYAPLMSIVRHPNGPVDQVVLAIASARGRGETPGQVLLLWAQQITGGVVVT
ncbi:NADP-dependent oxidoreductase domain-containing protein [Naematelia encephala]|uniref:NADP-dependent oxidoreductase domain-containing protein n=1 Tax=Naematelia encephala TaxID=71784 RepID=A0A1Y2BK48_9TREE|nr:NADP-dependent oxidoreductase domain-containing protein [Naematelia encephala]